MHLNEPRAEALTSEAVAATQRLKSAQKAACFWPKVAS